MKKQLSLALIASLCLSSMAGCGSAQPPAATSSGTSGTAQPASEAKASEQAAPSGDKITISYLNWNGGEEMRLQQEAFDEYMKANPNVEIKGQWVTENYDSKLNTLVSAGEAPDIFYNYEYAAIDWGERGVALDMAPLFQELGVNMTEEFVPTAIFTNQDKVYGVSTGPVCLLLYYNKPLFEKQNVATPSMDPKAPWTWDQFVEAAKKLTVDTAGNGPDSPDFKPKQIRTYGTNPPTSWLNIGPLLYSAGAGFGNADGTGSGLNTPEGIKVIQAVSDLINVHRASPDAAVSKTLPGMTQAFKNEQIGMAISGTWDYQNFMKEKIDFGVAPLPMFDKPANISWAATNQISAKTKNPKEVAKLLYFLVDPEQNPRQLAINFPNKKTYYSDDAKIKLWTENDQYLDDFRQIIPTIMGEIAIVPEACKLKNFNKIVADITVPELEKVFSGEVSAADGAANIEKLAAGEFQGKWD